VTTELLSGDRSAVEEAARNIEQAARNRFDAGHVYMLESSSDRAYKVGYSVSPIDRLYAIRKQANDKSISYVGSIRGALRLDEYAIHRELDELGLRWSGRYLGTFEWFHATAELDVLADVLRGLSIERRNARGFSYS
jgi:hypothetical protein